MGNQWFWLIVRYIVRFHRDLGQVPLTLPTYSSADWYALSRVVPRFRCSPLQRVPVWSVREKLCRGIPALRLASRLGFVTPIFGRRGAWEVQPFAIGWAPFVIGTIGLVSHGPPLRLGWDSCPVPPSARASPCVCKDTDSIVRFSSGFAIFCEFHS